MYKPIDLLKYEVMYKIDLLKYEVYVQTDRPLKI